MILSLILINVLRSKRGLKYKPTGLYVAFGSPISSEDVFIKVDIGGFLIQIR